MDEYKLQFQFTCTCRYGIGIHCHWLDDGERAVGDFVFRTGSEEALRGYLSGIGKLTESNEG